jgi:phage tail-like protein
MARSVRVDHAQNYRFRVAVVDEGGQSDISLLSPKAITLFGGSYASFARVSVPSVTIETEEIKEGVWPFRRRAIVGASMDTVLLERGVTIPDSDFWQWAVGAITGEIARKTVIIQLMARTQEPALFPGPQQDRMRSASLSGSLRLGQADIVQYKVNPVLPIVAKQWTLHECIPVRVKPASDLDASSAEVSLTELEIHANWMEQARSTFISTGGPEMLIT